MVLVTISSAYLNTSWICTVKDLRSSQSANIGRTAPPCEGDQKWLSAFRDDFATQDPFYPTMGGCTTTWSKSDRANSARFLFEKTFTKGGAREVDMVMAVEALKAPLWPRWDRYPGGRGGRRKCPGQGDHWNMLSNGRWENDRVSIGDPSGSPIC